MRAAEGALHAVTICTTATLAAAHRLGESFVAHHDGEITIHLCDASPDDVDLDLSERVHLAGRPGRDAPTTASTLVPWALAGALDEGRNPVVALAPTTLVVRPLTRLAQAALASGLAVVPRVLEPDDGEQPLEPDAVLTAGVVEPGVVACAEGPTTRRVLRWWKHAASLSPASERLMDLLPAFGAVLLRDPGLGVSRWNLTERPLHDSPYGPFAGDGPLRTCDLSGLGQGLPLRWEEDDGAPSPPLDDPYVASLAWQHVVTMGAR